MIDPDVQWSRLVSDGLVISDWREQFTPKNILPPHSKSRKSSKSDGITFSMLTEAILEQSLPENMDDLAQKTLLESKYLIPSTDPTQSIPNSNRVLLGACGLHLHPLIASSNSGRFRSIKCRVEWRISSQSDSRHPLKEQSNESSV